VISHELDQADNYVEVGLSLAIEGKSLRTCIAEAEEIIDNIKQISTDYCKQHATKEERKGCADLVEVSEYEVEPKYHNIRKVKTFSCTHISTQRSSSTTKSPLQSTTPRQWDPSSTLSLQLAAIASSSTKSFGRRIR
jgi:hypothetical protein